MDVSAVVAVIGAVISAAALILIARQVRLASEQTKHQRQVQRDAAQPYVWADIRLREQHGQFLMLVLKNEGPSVARSVTMTFDPPLPAEWRHGRPVGPAAVDRPGVYRFKALPPGRVMQWHLGIPTSVLDESGTTQFTVTIDAVGPYGPVEALTYAIEIGDYRDAAQTVPGTALAVVKALGGFACPSDLPWSQGRSGSPSQQQSRTCRWRGIDGAISGASGQT